MKQEWREFKHDEPGERFANHRERMSKKSKKHAAVSIALGVLLLAGGVVLLFIPGPGLLLIVFGLALVATHSKRLSNLMDRAEPRLRAAAHTAKQWWWAMPIAGKIALILAALGIGAGLAYLLWHFMLSKFFSGLI